MYMYIYIYACIYIYVRVYIYVCMYMCVSACILQDSFCRARLSLCARSCHHGSREESETTRRTAVIEAIRAKGRGEPRE